MTYDEIAAVFLSPRDEPFPVPVLPQTPARRLRDALEPIATQGWWSRPPNMRLEALGLGFLDGYIWGRAAALGTPEPGLVVATFGVFEPAMLQATYEQARATATREDVLAARAAGAEESLATFVSADEAAALADPLLRVLDRLDGMGRPLFSALRGLPRPASPAGRLWRAAELVREHRGDGHLAVCVSTGVDALAMNVLTELWLGYPLGAYTATRGYGPDAVAEALTQLAAVGWVAGGELTDDGRAARDALEEATDSSQGDLVRALGADLDAIVAAADAISDRIVAAGAFPPDPRKRAAG